MGLINKIYFSVFNENRSVADPRCLSRIPDPDFYTSRIPDPGSRIPDPKTVTKVRGEIFFFIILFCSHKLHKVKYYVIFEMLKKKIWANFQRIVEVFTQKIFICSQIYGFGIRDPRSGIRKKPIPDPGSRGQKGTGSRIRIRNTGKSDQYWSLNILLKLFDFGFEFAETAVLGTNGSTLATPGIDELL
jgi:hypothetical protein